MNGRLYDPLLHRFLMPDNYIQDPYNTQNFNRYGYVLNNPLKYIDPTGELTKAEFDDIIIQLQNSTHGGYWNEKKGMKFYKSENEAKGWTIGFMNENNSWGLYEGWAQSPQDLLSRSNTSITPDLVEGFFRQYWRGAYNIMADYAPNYGFNIASTLAMDINVGDVTITYVSYIKMMSLMESGLVGFNGENSFSGWRIANTMLGATNVVPSTIGMGTVLIKRSANYTDDIAKVAKISSRTGRVFGLGGMVMTTIDGYNSGWKNHHTADLFIGGIQTFLLGAGPVGWSIGLLWLTADIITTGVTGKSITENIFD